MAYLLGTDEAGYGPNFGPLLISATLWSAPDDVDAPTLFDRLNRVISPTLHDAGGRITMADSKAIYSPDRGPKNLERGLWPALAQLGKRPESWRDVWQSLAPEAIEPMRALPCYADYNAPAPSAANLAELDAAADFLREGLASAGVQLLAVKSRAIFAGEFNRLVEQNGSKGLMLSRETLSLAASLLETLPNGRIALTCDKHGGRNRYGDLLSERFPDWFVEIHGEGPKQSVYRFGPAERRIEFCFRVRAESCLPVALASMASKYLRELAMQAFNQFWQAETPNLRPTAGYPLDARRFRADIADAQKRLHIDDRVLWRAK
jgi:hypothetical protein